jgi:type VI secretion system protein VasG
MNLFYQVFDKGMLSDGEGREIDFKNTVLLLTSNLGSDVMTEMCLADPPPTTQEVVDAIRPILSNHFKPALLARMNIVPYFALGAEAMREIVDLKLGGLIGRLQTTHDIEMTIDSKVSDQIAARCQEVETGARNIDHIMSRTLLPLISRAMLDQMSKGPMPAKMQLVLADHGDFKLNFDS